MHFEKWGARYIAQLVEEEFDLSPGQPHTLAIQDVADDALPDTIISELNHIQGMDEQTAFARIVSLMGRVSGASYTGLLFERANEMFLHFEAPASSPSIKEPRNMKYISHLSHKIVRYVQRTGEDVIIDHAPHTGIFANDPYIADKHHISILCIPVTYLGILAGVVYQEKAGAFSPAEIDNLKGVIPSLVAKITTIGNINLKSIVNPPKTVSPLSSREQEILELIAEGISNSDISRRLGIATGTVRNHLSNIYGKLEADNRVQAVIRAKELNLIDI